jgi:hypothetical protein
MAKTLKTTKDKLVTLLNVTDQVPAAKLATDIGKHLGFRKALKKLLKDYTDAKAEAQNNVRERQKVIVGEIQKVDKELAPIIDEALKAPLLEQKAKLEAELQDFVMGENAKLDALMEDMKVKKVEVVFDNEEFLFEKNVIKDNAVAIFTRDKDKFNSDYAEIIFDILDSVE